VVIPLFYLSDDWQLLQSRVKLNIKAVASVGDDLFSIQRRYKR
jgi:hypothetical protein